ncbi:mismatch-specific DNA-glycosylase [Egicoccus halophilus]|uniref:Mismatch-specific DNA-glycosylase n=1 Tax=Egicoccus halophilus TaxID=1670830 RepID=A0A8J3AGE7_9ACTN|nr:mismatch-specific DNA-glycosylase [Egicoccus halophilus]GGI08304.1 mismatch-specific DNA-glycosylase [Egicoccus halophilus]
MGLSREQLEAHRDATVPDLVGEWPPRLVFVGINPGLWTAATQTHFAHPGNRFYPALHRAGITDRVLDRVEGLDDADRRQLTDRGIAITNVVPRATAAASELTRAELREGGEALVSRLEAWAPKVVAIAGVTAYRSAFGRPKAQMGRQPEPLAGAELWVVPNPSGLNAHETIDSLAAWYRQVAEAASIV